MFTTIMLSKWSHFKKLLCQLLCMMVVMYDGCDDNYYVTMIMNDNDYE